MVEIFYFKNGAIITKLNATVKNLNVWGILMSRCISDCVVTVHVKELENGRHVQFEREQIMVHV
jgi:hypothetical protein